MTPQEAINIIEDVTWQDNGRHYGKIAPAREIAISALEKQIPRKVEILTYQPLINSGWEYRCPNCGCAVGKNNNLGFAYEEYLEPYEVYCSQCGQALDWSDTE